MTRYTAAYENEINAFVEAVKDKKQSRPQLGAMVEALRLAEAAFGGYKNRTCR